MNTKPLFALTISIGLLAACGSGGNDSPSSSSTPTTSSVSKPNTHTQATNIPPFLPTHDVGQSSVHSHSTVTHPNTFGFYYTPNNQGNTPTATQSGHINTLIIGETQFNLRTVKLANASDCYNQNKQCDVAIYSDGDIRFGFINSGKKNNHIIFAQGEPTQLAEIPTSGTILYEGKTVMYNHQSNQYQKDIPSLFTADFDQKSFSGLIFHSKNEAPYELNAQISGNTFKGDNTRFHTEGGFYGSHAKQVAGVFRDKQTKEVGAFGGKEPEKP